MKLVWDWITALSAPLALVPGLENVPLETLTNIVHQDNFESVRSLIQVNHRFRQDIPRMCYHKYWDETEAFHQSMVEEPTTFKLFKCEYALWAILHYVKSRIDLYKKLDGLAHFMIFVGHSPSISKKLVKLVTILCRSTSDRKTFRRHLDIKYKLHYATVQWSLPSHAFSFLFTEPSFESSYHLPLLRLGVHPNQNDVLTRSLASGLVDFLRDHPDGKDQVEIEKWSVLGTIRRIKRQWLGEPILAVADFFYLISGDQWEKSMTSLELFASTTIGQEISLCYSASLFELRMSEPTNAYGLLLTLEYVSLPESFGASLIELLRHPSLIEHFKVFEESFDNLLSGDPVNISGFTPLMKRAFQNYAVVRMDQATKSRLHERFWRMKDPDQAAICAECLPFLDFRFLYRYGKKIRPTTDLASAFTKFHWEIIFTRCVTDNALFLFMTNWIHRDIVEFLLMRSGGVVDSYRTMMTASTDFRNIFEFICKNLKRRRLILEDDYWQVVHVL